MHDPLPRFWRNTRRTSSRRFPIPHTEPTIRLLPRSGSYLPRSGCEKPWSIGEQLLPHVVLSPTQVIAPPDGRFRTNRLICCWFANTSNPVPHRSIHMWWLGQWLVAQVKAVSRKLNKRRSAKLIHVPVATRIESLMNFLGDVRDYVAMFRTSTGID